MKDSSGYDSPRVLIVDDDDLTRMVIAETLTAVGMIVEEAADGREALAAFESHRPDAVLLDVMMPGMDGYETCQAVRRLPGAEYLPVVPHTKTLTTGRFITVLSTGEHRGRWSRGGRSRADLTHLAHRWDASAGAGIMAGVQKKSGPPR